ncbi:MAG TPA: S8 family serine peptidase, partial [Thermoanaerobaculia bacterium]
MERFVARVAVVLLCSFSAVVALADASDVVSTQCAEVELSLNGASVSRIGDCGDGRGEDLLWHLDRIDQINGALDGSFDRRNGGAGSTVYVMDTGVMARHSEFAGDGGSRVIAGYDVSGSVRIGTSTCTSDNKATAPCYADFNELTAASHGTGVASIVAGNTVGVAPKAAIVSVRVMNERGLATTRTYLDGLNAIIRHAWDPRTPAFRTAVVNISGWVLERLTAGDVRGAVPYGTVEQKMRDMIAGVDANGNVDASGRRFLFVVAGNNLDGGCGSSGYVDR